MHRSKTREVPTPVDPKDLKARNAKVEKAALAALAVGDVRKALQALNSAPIAPACEETYRKLVDLHPVGANPDPVERKPGSEAPYFKSDVVRSVLSLSLIHI